MICTYLAVTLHGMVEGCMYAKRANGQTCDTTSARAVVGAVSPREERRAGRAT